MTMDDRGVTPYDLELLRLADAVAAKYPQTMLSDDGLNVWDHNEFGVPLPIVPVEGDHLVPLDDTELMTPQLQELFIAQKMVLSVNAPDVWHARKGYAEVLVQGKTAAEAILKALLATDGDSA